MSEHESQQRIDHRHEMPTRNYGNSPIGMRAGAHMRTLYEAMRLNGARAGSLNMGALEQCGVTNIRHLLDRGLIIRQVRIIGPNKDIAIDGNNSQGPALYIKSSVGKLVHIPRMSGNTIDNLQEVLKGAKNIGRGVTEQLIPTDKFSQIEREFIIEIPTLK